MKINKVIIGYVVQVFDTKTRQYESQEFIASDDIAYEDRVGTPVSEEMENIIMEAPDLETDMVQPAEKEIDAKQ